MQISILGTDGAYLANNGSNAISILGPDGNLLPNDGTNFVCVTGSDGAYQPNDGTREAFSILGTDGALLPYVEGNSFSVLDANGALAIPVTDNLISPLLWGGAQGAWYDPSDLSTMFADYTFVNPVTASGDLVGMILDKRLGLSLGAEVFNTASVGLSGATTLVSPGEYRITSDGTFSAVLISAVMTNGGIYKVSYEIVANPGGIALTFGNGSRRLEGAVGVHSHYAYSDGPDVVIKRYSAGTDCTIKNISIKLVAGNHAYQATSASRPIFRDVGGLRYLEFDGVDDYLRATFTIAQPIDRISAIRQVTWTSNDQLFGGGAENYGVLYQADGSPNLYTYAGLNGGPTGALAVGVTGVVTERQSGATSRIAVNSGAYIIDDAGTTLPGGITLGASAASMAGGSPANMHLHQMIMRGSTTAMTDARIAAGRALCAAKSGVTL